MADDWGLVNRHDENFKLPRESRMLLQLLKIQEETGEVAEAVIGATGQNRMCWGTHGRRTAHEETTPDTGRPQPVCGACSDPILSTECACRTCGKVRQHRTPTTTGGSSLRRHTT